MSSPAKPPISRDPAAVWWGTASQQQEPAPVEFRPLPSFAHEEPVSEWRWHYSRWIGIMYGPIPIGLIIAIPILILLWTR